MSRVLVLIITISSGDSSGSSSLTVTLLVTGVEEQEGSPIGRMHSVSFSLDPLNMVSCLTDLSAGDTTLVPGG